MSLFTNLLNLHSGNKPLEDFFTEIVAYFFSVNTDLLIAWLKYNLIINDDNYSSIKITTQKCYEALEKHDRASQPDIVIELGNDTKTNLLFIESKIGSNEGWKQLENYADILNNLAYPCQRTLIYITRDYEQKENIKNYIVNSSLRVNFYHLRWYQFYIFLKKCSNDSITKEILIFMELNMMSQNNLLSPVDILTIKNFNKTLNFMEASLSEEVSAKFKQTFEGFNKATLDSLYQWKSKKRYIISTHLSSKKMDFWCGLGYFDLDTVNLNEYPSLGIYLEVSPSFESRTNIIESMQKVINAHPDKWFPINLVKYPAWSAIIYKKSLQSFLATEDHLFAIKQFFLDSIDELKNIQPYFHDSWKSISTEEAVKEER